MQSEDYEKVKVADKYKNEDFLPMISDFFSNIKPKNMFFLFLLFLIVSSDVFINRTLRHIKGAVGYMNEATTYGTVIQGIILVIAYAIIAFLIERS